MAAILSATPSTSNDTVSFRVFLFIVIIGMLLF
jgi:hypothetical protein